MSAAPQRTVYKVPLVVAGAAPVLAMGRSGRSATAARGRVPGQATRSERVEPARVLVIEPDASARGVLASKLTAAGFDVLAVASLGEARRCLSPELEPPSAVVVEAALPDGDGIALCRELRSDIRTAPMPLIVLARGSARRGEAIDAGADDFLARPVFVADVVALVKLRTARAPLDQGFLLDTEDVPLAELTRALLASKASGRLALEGTRSELTFRSGRLVDARFRDAVGEVALRRILLLARGPFVVRFGTQLSRATLALDELEFNVRVMGLVRRGLRAIAAGVRLDAKASVQFKAMPREIDGVPEAWIPVLRLCDGVRTVDRVVLESGLDEGMALEALAGLSARQLVLIPVDGEGEAVEPIPLPRIEEGLAPELQRQLAAFRIAAVVEVDRRKARGEVVQLFPRPNPTELETALEKLTDD